jgi:phosphoribosylaminoimidazole carboxylase (NCAIR synthetase)
MLIVSLLFTRELASISDVITIEIEHVNVAPLEELEKAGRIVQPTPATIRIIQVCTYVFFVRYYYYYN